jgi:hypothetical protein
VSWAEDRLIESHQLMPSTLSELLVESKLHLPIVETAMTRGEAAKE